MGMVWEAYGLPGSQSFVEQIQVNSLEDSAFSEFRPSKICMWSAWWYSECSEISCDKLRWSWWFFCMFLGVFPERRFVAGFFRRLFAYLTPHISHTYPAHHTYPTHIHSKRIHHAYPTHIQHIAHIPHISIPNVSHPYVSHQYVSMQCVSIQKVVIRIPPITTHIPYISSTSYISHTYPFQTYPFQTYPTNTYPLQTYPFKRCASAGIANVSHQYISHQYVSSTRIPPVRIHSMRIHSKSLHQQEWQWVWASLHIISYHCYSAGMVMNIETLLFLQFVCKIINWI